MPRKTKPVVSPDEVWVAPRPADTPKPLAFEPVGTAQSNRYLEFADIALGQAPQSKKRNRGTAGRAQHENAEGKVTPIRHARAPRFGAFRNSR